MNVDFWGNMKIGKVSDLCAVSLYYGRYYKNITEMNSLLMIDVEFSVLFKHNSTL